MLILNAALSTDKHQAELKACRESALGLPCPALVNQILIVPTLWGLS